MRPDPAESGLEDLAVLDIGRAAIGTVHVDAAQVSHNNRCLSLHWSIFLSVTVQPITTNPPTNSFGPVHTYTQNRWPVSTMTILNSCEPLPKYYFHPHSSNSRPAVLDTPTQSTDPVPFLS